MSRTRSRRCARRKGESLNVRGRKLASPELLESRVPPGAGLLETLIALSLARPWDSIGPSGADQTVLSISATRPVRHQGPVEQGGLFSGDRQGFPFLTALRARLHEQDRESVAERLSGGVDLPAADRAYKTPQNWVTSSAFDGLAETLALDLALSLHLSPSQNAGAARGGSGVLSSGLSTEDYEYNSPPIAYDDVFGAFHDQTVNASAPGVLYGDLDWDGDPLTAELVSGPSYAASFTFNDDGSFTYVPPAHWSGGDSFTYKAYDGQEYSNEATVNVYIYNSPPSASSDDYGTQHDVTLNVAAPGVLGNDEDWDGDPGKRADACNVLHAQRRWVIYVCAAG